MQKAETLIVVKQRSGKATAAKKLGDFTFQRNQFYGATYRDKTFCKVTY